MRFPLVLAILCTGSSAKADGVAGDVPLPLVFAAAGGVGFIARR
jgi:hypothetical protein